MAKLLGPLDKQSCIYFFVLAAFFLVVLIATLLSEIYFIITHYKELNRRLMMNGILMLFNVFVAYFVNRLLYSMCSKSLA